MSWRERVRPASFRGVEFQADRGREPVGRQTQVHEYPQRDLPMVEDLGRVTRPIKLVAWLAGPDAFERRDELLKALDEPGPGELVHPWMGRMTVTATDCEMTHDRREGGVVRFDLTFVAGGELEFPSAQPNTAVGTALAAQEVAQTSQERFEGVMAGVDMARVQLSNVQGLIQDVANQIAEVVSLEGVLNLVEDVQATYQSIVNAPAAFAQAVLGEVNKVRRVFSGFGDMISSGGVSLSGILSQVRAIERLGGLEMPGGQDASKFSAAYVGLIQDAVLLSTLSDVAEIPAGRAPAVISGVPMVEAKTESLSFTTTEAWKLADSMLAGQERQVPVAEDVRGVAVSLSDAIWRMSSDASIEHFESLAQARIRAGRHLSSVARSGVRLTTVEPPAVVPALVLAYRLYGDSSRAGELLARNRVEHPGFVPVLPLEVAQP